MKNQIVEDALSKEEIEKRMRTSFVGKEIYYRECTESTNQDAAKYLEEGAEQGLLVVSDQQTKGRGRRGRIWQSPPGTNIYMSLGLKPEILPDEAPMITPIQAMAVACAIREICQLDATIKWPNDVVINGKKVCGILTEMVLKKDAVSHVIIGTGINVNGDAFCQELQDVATSLYLETGKLYNRSQLVGKTLEYFEKFYNQFLQTKDLSLLMETYNELLINCEKTVRVLDLQNPFTGIAKGIDEKGRLIVEKSDGQTETVYAGEVSVRGVYGYV